MSNFKMKSLVRWDIGLFILFTLFIFAFPNVDIQLASIFYDPETSKFIGLQSSVLHFFYKLFAFVHIPILIGLIASIFYFSKSKRTLYKKYTIFILCSLLLGPGILVNLVLKDNTIGRARPLQTTLFGGASEFTQPFEYSGACRKNCSFVSGHAAIGYVFMVLAWVFRKKRFLVGGILLGFLLGVMRMAQGAHFFSDIIYAGFFVYFTCAILARFFDLSIEEKQGMDL